MPDDFDTLRPYLASYLQGKGISLRKRFRCLNPDHPDRNPSMGYDARREKVHCFACGADYDLFDLLQIEHHLSSPGEALRIAAQLYGGGDGKEKTPPAKRKSAPDRAERPEGKGAQPQSGEAVDFFSDKSSQSTSESAAAGREEQLPALEQPAPQTPEEYLAARGISPETAARFGVRGSEDGSAVVLPCDGNSQVLRSIVGKQYRNPSGIPSPLFQAERLTSGEPVLVVEGVFDALSAYELGFTACAMNGSGNREKIAACLRTLPRPAPVLLLPDNDRAGDEWSAALLAEFPWLYRCPALPVGKDLNEFLCADRAAAKAFLSAAMAECLTQLPPPYEETSAAGQLSAFDDYIAAQALRPPLCTGFPRLDALLDGGLYDGLYVLGAVSSLGKTAFCMQIADQLAQTGRDVLVFTLEMTAYELMARSISRESFLLDTTSGKGLSRTIRGVLDGRRYPRYSQAEQDNLRAARDRYAAYAKHLYFREGDHETGVDYISREVRRHIAETGQRPVVLVDYLQILAPVDVHFTDKQNLDRTVCALKKLSRQEGLTILAISSFNRENYNVEATMSAFKESGGIDYSADVLIGLQARGAGKRSFNMEEEKRKNPRELELKILKNRTGAIPDALSYRYYPAYSCFEEG